MSGLETDKTCLGLDAYIMLKFRQEHNSIDKNSERKKIKKSTKNVQKPDPTPKIHQIRGPVPPTRPAGPSDPWTTLNLVTDLLFLSGLRDVTRGQLYIRYLYSLHLKHTPLRERSTTGMHDGSPVHPILS